MSELPPEFKKDYMIAIRSKEVALYRNNKKVETITIEQGWTLQDITNMVNEWISDSWSWGKLCRTKRSIYHNVELK